MIIRKENNEKRKENNEKRTRIEEKKIKRREERWKEGIIIKKEEKNPSM